MVNCILFSCIAALCFSGANSQPARRELRPWVRVKCLPDSVLNPGCVVHLGWGGRGRWLGGTEAGPWLHTRDTAVHLQRVSRGKGRRAGSQAGESAPWTLELERQKARSGRIRGRWKWEDGVVGPWSRTCPSWRAGSGWRPSAGCRQSRPRCGRGAARWAHPRGKSTGSCRGAAAPSRRSGDPWG